MSETGPEEVAARPRGRPVARSRRPAPENRAAPEGGAVTESPVESAAQAPTAPSPARRRRPPTRRRRGSPAAELSTGAIAETAAGEPTDAEPSAVDAPGGEAPGRVAINIAVPRGWGRRISAKLVQSVVERAFELEGWSGAASIDVLMVSDDEMREVNATRRGIDEATDVLSFPLVELKPGAGLTQDFFVLPPDATLHVGDVVLSVDRIEPQAREAGHSLERELAYLTVHGVLHILGYEHDTEPDRRKMRKREEEVLSGLGIRREADSGARPSPAAR